MKKFQHNIPHLHDDEEDNNVSKPYFCNGTSHPSLEIGLFRDENIESITIQNHSIREFNTPEKGLARNISKDSWKIFSSEDVMLKVPEIYFLHHFIYNCKTSAFIPRNDSTISRSTLTKTDNEQLRNSSSYACPSLNSNVQPQNSKSQTEIVLKIPKGYHPDSMIDIRLIGTTLHLKNSILGVEDECECLNLFYDLDNTKQRSNYAETERKCHSPLHLKEVDSVQKDIGTAAADEKKVSIKLGENIFLSLITSNDDQEENSIEKCNLPKQSEGRDTTEIPSIKILLKCNGQTIRELSSPGPADRRNTNDKRVSDQQDYNQIINLHTFKEQNTKVEIDKYADIYCGNETKKGDISSLECCQTSSMVVDTTIPIKNIYSNKRKGPICSLREQTFDVSGGTCPLVTTVCNVLSRIEKKEARNSISAIKKATNSTKKSARSSQPPKKKVRKQSIDNKYANLQPEKPVRQVQEKPEVKSKRDSIMDKLDGKNKKSTSSLKDSISKESVTSSATNQLSILCSCPPNKDDIASLGSFSLFFIINDMNAEDYGCEDSDSNELLETAMICIHVDDSQSNQMEQFSNASTSCPVICSCPSTPIYKSSCSCPSIRAAPKPPICSCPSLKLQPFIQNTPCYQRSQIKFSPTPQSDVDKSCSIMVSPNQMSACTQCRFCSAVKLKQTSVQVNPSCIDAPSPQSVQTSISQKSASVQPSICTTQPCSQAIAAQLLQVLSKIVPPSYKINLSKLGSRILERSSCTAANIPPQRIAANHPTTRDIKAGPSVTITTVKNLPCRPSNPAIICSPFNAKPNFRNPSDMCIRECVATQSKNCSRCVDMSGLTDLTNQTLKKVCSVSGECKQNDQSATSKEIMITEPKTAPYKEKPRLVPASPRLKRFKNFNELSHLDVSGADNFIYDESTKGDLNLITQDYSDLKEAFEKFMVKENQKNFKCKFIKKD